MTTEKVNGWGSLVRDLCAVSLPGISTVTTGTPVAHRGAGAVMLSAATRLGQDVLAPPSPKRLEARRPAASVPGADGPSRRERSDDRGRRSRPGPSRPHPPQAS